jgi:hypothetical protein
MGKEMEAADEDGEAGTAKGGVMALECGGGARVDEECLEPETRLLVKGVGAQGRRSLAMKLVAWVDNGMGFLACTPYGEEDEIKRE